MRVDTSCSIHHRSTSTRIAEACLLACLSVVSAAAIADEPHTSKTQVAAATEVLEIAPGSTLSLDGDSTLHRYSAKAGEFSATFKLAAAISPGQQTVDSLFRNHEIVSAELVIPVANLDSGEAGLDADLRKALHAEKNKYIVLHIKSYEVQNAAAEGGTFRLVLHTALSIAGIKRDVEIFASVTDTPGGVRLTGYKDLLMSDYKLEPPSRLFGAVKATDRVTISFNLTIRQKPSSGLLAR
jgi:polyisoprenoid-binding protein YceI